jgi:hypothetical protein
MRKPSPAMIVALAALFVALGGVGVAATGGNFILGQSNTADKATALSAPVAGGKALQLSNTSTTSGATALGLGVASGHAPFTVNSATKVGNLNADKLDGVDSTQFQRVGLVHWGEAYQDSVGEQVVIRWPQLAAITTDGDADTDNTIHIVNLSTGEIQFASASGPGVEDPGITLTAAAGWLTTFIVRSADNARSWLVACSGAFSRAGHHTIQCQGVASRVD